MKYKYTLIFTAEITETIDFPENIEIQPTSEEEKREILLEGLKELCSDNATVIVHDFKVIEN